METPADVKPVIINDADRYSKNPSYSENFNSYTADTAFTSASGKYKGTWEVTGTANVKSHNGSNALALSNGAKVKSVKLPKNITAGDSYAKQQIWEVTVTLPTSGTLHLLRCASTDPGVKIVSGKVYFAKGTSTQLLSGVTLTAGSTYTIRREINLNTSKSSYTIFDANGNRLGGTSNLAMVSYDTASVYVDFYAQSISGTAYIDNFKMYPTGVTTGFEIYNAETGFKDTSGNARTADTAYRLSWMNASSEYKVAKVMNNGVVIAQIQMAPGADGVATDIIPYAEGDAAINLTVTTVSGTATTLPNYDNGDFAWSAPAEALGLASGKSDGKNVDLSGNTHVIIHNLVQVPAKEPTATAPGWAAYEYCLDCDYTTKVETTICSHEKTSHPAKDPTCTEIGWKAYQTCATCGYSSYEELPALGHNTVQHAGQTATCTEPGWNAYETCSRCDYTTYKAVSALGHNIVKHEAKAPTHLEHGWNAYETCSRCDYTTYVELPAEGHNLVSYEAKAPTCTEPGWNTYEACSKCDYSTIEEVPALGHNTIQHEGQDATCTEPGWNAYVTCSRCDYTTYRAVSALGHALVHHEAKAPTTTEVGWNAYDTCSRCDYTTYVELPIKKTVITKALTLMGVRKTVDDDDTTTDIPQAYYWYTGDDGIPVEVKETDNWNISYGIVNGVPTVTLKSAVYKHSANFINLSPTIDGSRTQYTGQLDIVYEGVNDIQYTGGSVIYLYKGKPKVEFKGAKDAVLNISGGASASHVLNFTSEAANSTNAPYLNFTGGTVNITRTVEGRMAALYVAEMHVNITNCTLNIENNMSNADCYHAAFQVGATYNTNSSSKNGYRKLTITNSNVNVTTNSVMGIAIVNSKTSSPYVNSVYNDLIIDQSNVFVTVNNSKGKGTFGGVLAYDIHIKNGSILEVSATTTKDGVTMEPIVLKNASSTGPILDEYKKTFVVTTNAGYYKVTPDFTVYDCSHAVTNTVSGYPAKCDTTGLTDKVECKLCGAVLQEAEEIAATGHSYSSEVTKEPTCTEKGIETYTCACGNSYTKEIAANGHTLTQVGAKAPTCTEAGHKAYEYCTECDYTTYEEIAANGHSYTSKVTKAPTCTEKGIKTYTCSCGKSYTEEIAANGHTLTQVGAKAPTCTEAGYKAYEYCSECDYTTYEAVAATGHSYTSAVTKAPTCTEKGVKTFTCSCGDTYTEEIAANGHTLTQVGAKAPTCTEAGHEAYEYCTKCDYTTYEEIAATGHSYTSKVTKEPTCTEKGIKTYTCSCGKSYTKEIATESHSYTDGFCSICGAEHISSAYVAIADGKKYRSLAAAIYYANGKEVKLLKARVNYGALTITKDTKINLNGNYLYFEETENTTAAITINPGKTLHIYGGDLRVYSGNSYTTMIENNGNLIITNVVARGTELGGDDPIVLLNNGTATVEGASAVVAASNSNYVIVNNGTCEINIKETAEINARIQGVLAQEEGKLTLTAIKLYGKLTYTAGVVTRSSDAVPVSAPKGYTWCNNILGVHSFTSKASDKKATDADCKNAATYYVQCDNCDTVSDTKTVASGSVRLHSYKDGYCSACGAKDPGTNAVAKVGNVGYATLAEAIAAANGQEIKLLKTVYSDALVISGDVKINIGAYMLYIKQTAGATAGITIESGATLTLIGGDLRISGVNSFTALIENDGTLVVTDVVIRGTELGGVNPIVLLNNGIATVEGASAVVAASNSNYVIVNKGACTINIAAANGINARIQGVLAQEEGKLTLTAIKLYGKLTYTAGVVTRSSETVSVSAPKGYFWCNNVLGTHSFTNKASDKKATDADCKNAATYYVRCDNCDAVSDTKTVAIGSSKGHEYKNGSCSVCGAKDPGANAVAKVGNVGYATLAEAIAAANGQEIKLLKTVYSGALVISGDVKINIGAYMLYIKQTDGATAGITIESGATLTLIGGDLRVTGANSFTALIENDGTLVITDVVIRGTELDGENPIVLLNNGSATVEGASAGGYFNFCHRQKCKSIPLISNRKSAPVKRQVPKNLTLQ